MHVFISGGGGFLGARLASALLERGTVDGPDRTGQTISGITCFDAAFPRPMDPRIRCVTGDIAAPGVIAAAMPADSAWVFHFAAVVSGGAEADFDLGYRVNLDGARQMLEACRALAKPPRFVQTSSVAAFGGDMPAVLDDSTIANPQTSYGSQKVIAEYLASDYARKGFVDARSVRLPTIIVRPGKPNAAASSFASGILREPLAGEPANCPVDPAIGVWVLSPRQAIASFIRTIELPREAWGVNRVLNLPGISVSSREAVDALARIAGPKVAARVTFNREPRIEALVKTWPERFRTPRADALGFRADANIDAIIRAYIEEEGVKI